MSYLMCKHFCRPLTTRPVDNPASVVIEGNRVRPYSRGTKLITPGIRAEVNSLLGTHLNVERLREFLVRDRVYKVSDRVRLSLVEGRAVEGVIKDILVTRNVEVVRRILGKPNETKASHCLSLQVAELIGDGRFEMPDYTTVPWSKVNNISSIN